MHHSVRKIIDVWLQYETGPMRKEERLVIDLRFVTPIPDLACRANKLLVYRCSRTFRMSHLDRPGPETIPAKDTRILHRYRWRMLSTE